MVIEHIQLKRVNTYITRIEKINHQCNKQSNTKKVKLFFILLCTFKIQVRKTFTMLIIVHVVEKTFCSHANLKTLKFQQKTVKIGMLK